MGMVQHSRFGQTVFKIFEIMYLKNDLSYKADFLCVNKQRLQIFFQHFQIGYFSILGESIESVF